MTAAKDTRAPKSQSGVTMPPEMWAYVEAIRATGVLGASTSGVIRALVSQGIQRAIASRVIKPRIEP